MFETYRFRMKRVDGEQQRRHASGPGTDERTAETQKQKAHNGVKKHVDCVIAHRPKAVKGEVGTKRQRCQWSIGFVALFLQRQKETEYVNQTSDSSEG